MKLIPADKGTHFVAGAGLTALALMVVPLLPAAAVCMVAAVLRECYGLWRRGRWDWLDIAWTLAGGAAVLLGAVAPQGLA
jgi:hypothetical protein